MLFYKMAFGGCLLLLLVTYRTLAAARKKRNQPSLRVLHLFRSGLTLSACSYLLRLLETPQEGGTRFFSFATCLLGTIFLWLGWLECRRQRAEQRDTCFALSEEEREPVSESLTASFSAIGVPPLTARAHHVLLRAEYEAYRHQSCCVDTGHLLLGLLHDPHSTGARILEISGSLPEKVQSEIAGRMAAPRKCLKSPMPDTERQMIVGVPRLTEGAKYVLTLAAQESHRFGRDSVGTEHLLLGLLLVGKGMATEVLFRNGITVEMVRREIQLSKS